MEYISEKKEKVEKNYERDEFFKKSSVFAEQILYSPTFVPLVNMKILSRLRFSEKSDTMSQRQ